MSVLLSDILDTPNGARFYRCDLHVHTQNSYDYNGTPSIEEIIEKSLEKGLDIIGITDHNFVGDIEAYVEKGKEKGLIIFPGVELSVNCVSKVIHIIALFDPETSKEDLQYVLSNVGIKPDDQGREGAYTSTTMSDVLSTIDSNNGIAIAAHVDGPKGLWSEAEHQTRIDLCNNELILAFEVNDLETFRIPEGGDYNREIPLIQSSDAHSISEIGAKITRLKMENFTIDGLKQAFVDKNSRIKMEGISELINYPKIIGMSVDGGFIDEVIYHFNSNLNCYVGGRGTGKSTSIELLRYCLDSLPDLEPYRKRRLEMIDSVLDKGIINVYVETSENNIYNIKRKFGESPLVFNSSGDLVDVKVNDMFPITVYGERELNDVSYDSTAQLRLIDSFISDLDDLIRNEKETLDDLDVNAGEIISLERTMFDLEQDLSGLSSINETLQNLKTYNFEEKLEDKKKIEEEKIILKRIFDSIEKIEDNFNENKINEYAKQIQEQSFKDINYRDYPNGTAMKSISYHFERLVKYLEKVKKEKAVYLGGIKQKIIDNNEKIVSSHIKQEGVLLKIMKELGSEAISEAAKKWSELQKRKVILEGKKKDLEISRGSLTLLKETRETLITSLLETRLKIYNKRDDEARIINEHIGKDIEISIIKNGNNDDYLSKLEELTKGSGGFQTHKEMIVKTLTPFELFHYIESQDYVGISTKCDITENSAEKILGYSNLKNNKYKIQEVLVPDLPLIKLQVGYEKKSLNALSLGQRCTTLLSLILLKIKTPLILDTPEEGLDNIYVFNTLVKALKEIKEKRQIIIATHNANIPVSGDSELIYCLKSDASKGEIKCFGSIENKIMKDAIQEVLEGGKKAFKIRMKRYGY